MRAGFYTIEQISPNREITPEGYLLCRDTPVARTGEQEYGPGETPLETGPDDKVIITRTPEEVFSPKTMDSANGKSFVNDHPYSDDENKSDVNPDNWKDLTDGVMLSPRRGAAPDDSLLLVDLLVCDKNAIRLVQGGKVELSLGYVAEYIEDAPGRGRQVNIVINHVALVEQGRCGQECKIRDRARVRDSASGCGCSGGSQMKKLGGPKFQRVRDAIASLRSTRDEKELEKAAEKAEDAIAEAMDSEREEAKEEGKKEAARDTGAGDFVTKEAFDAAMKANDVAHKAHDAKFKAHDDRLDALEDGEKESEAEKKATEDAMEEEANEGKGKDARKAKDSALLSDSYRETLSMAEIIAPGLHVQTFDAKHEPSKTLDAMCALRRKALGVAASTTDGAVVIQGIRGGRTLDAATISAMGCKDVRTLFFATGTALKTQRTNDGASSSAARTSDAATSTPVDVNKRNREFWGR